MTPIQSAQEYVDSGCCCDQFSKEHIVALIAECERLGAALQNVLTVRDHFAGLAMQAMIGNTHKDDCSKGHAGVDIFPAYAYEMADAMLAARKEQS